MHKGLYNPYLISSSMNQQQCQQVFNIHEKINYSLLHDPNIQYPLSNNEQSNQNKAWKFDFSTDPEKMRLNSIPLDFNPFSLDTSSDSYTSRMSEDILENPYQRFDGPFYDIKKSASIPEADNLLTKQGSSRKDNSRNESLNNFTKIRCMNQASSTTTTNINNSSPTFNLEINNAGLKNEKYMNQEGPDSIQFGFSKCSISNSYGNNQKYVDEHPIPRNCSLKSLNAGNQSILSNNENLIPTTIIIPNITDYSQMKNDSMNELKMLQMQILLKSNQSKESLLVNKNNKQETTNLNMEEYSIKNNYSFSIADNNKILQEINSSNEQYQLACITYGNLHNIQSDTNSSNEHSLRNSYQYNMSNKKSSKENSLNNTLDLNLNEPNIPKPSYRKTRGSSVLNNQSQQKFDHTSYPPLSQAKNKGNIPQTQGNNLLYSPSSTANYQNQVNYNHIPIGKYSNDIKPSNENHLHRKPFSLDGKEKWINNSDKKPLENNSLIFTTKCENLSNNKLENMNSTLNLLKALPKHNNIHNKIQDQNQPQFDGLENFESKSEDTAAKLVQEIKPRLRLFDKTNSLNAIEIKIGQSNDHINTASDTNEKRTPTNKKVLAEIKNEDSSASKIRIQNMILKKVNDYMNKSIDAARNLFRNQSPQKISKAEDLNSKRISQQEDIQNFLSNVSSYQKDDNSKQSIIPTFCLNCEKNLFVSDAKTHLNHCIEVSKSLLEKTLDHTFQTNEKFLSYLKQTTPQDINKKLETLINLVNLKLQLLLEFLNDKNNIEREKLLGLIQIGLAKTHQIHDNNVNEKRISIDIQFIKEAINLAKQNVDQAISAIFLVYFEKIIFYGEQKAILIEQEYQRSVEDIAEEKHVTLREKSQKYSTPIKNSLKDVNHFQSSISIIEPHKFEDSGTKNTLMTNRSKPTNEFNSSFLNESSYDNKPLNNLKLRSRSSIGDLGSIKKQNNMLNTPDKRFKIFESNKLSEHNGFSGQKLHKNPEYIKREFLNFAIEWRNKLLNTNTNNQLKLNLLIKEVLDEILIFELNKEHWETYLIERYKKYFSSQD